ncbi:Flagellum-specific peptidoglycan hydrolase FlgJ [Lutibacter agarilyticus]|uniref:Peptidoglycan hydrolase n=1 Tax=Lutibacter agarilyticus TaxID=1109740 RepID=A0A238WM39_9FLAO|nr:glucosaminidase domain-containing protein [Lutibacter agarilyticus]SNR47640.1 Flagellum-specific peptidoglycan hydrolase FlgJ [Lutibacter agarilyticus]
MKFKYILICLFIVSLLASCKSKKSAVKKQSKPVVKEIVQPKVETIEPVKKTEEVKSVITNSTEEYIKQYSDISVKEMRDYKIPASITLAQGILESSSGRSLLTLRSNNHFGIKCHKGWKGKKTYHDDDEKGECFRVYKDPRTSFKDHSEFLTTRSRYSSLFELEPGDYVGWAKGLSAAGYATDRRYPAKLIGLIEKYNLHKFDMEVLGKNYNKPKLSKTSNHEVVKGDTLYSISRKYGLSVDKLKKINGLNSNNISIGQTLLIK